MSLQSAQVASGHPGAVNDLVLRLVAGSNRADVQREVASAVSTLGGAVTSRDDDPVYTGLYADARNDQETWNAFALLILLGAGFAAFNLVTRLIDAQRREIGVGMALGVSLLEPRYPAAPGRGSGRGRGSDRRSRRRLVAELGHAQPDDGPHPAAYLAHAFPDGAVPASGGARSGDPHRGDRPTAAARPPPSTGGRDPHRRLREWDRHQQAYHAAAASASARPDVPYDAPAKRPAGAAPDAAHCPRRCCCRHVPRRRAWHARQLLRHG